MKRLMLLLVLTLGLGAARAQIYLNDAELLWLNNTRARIELEGLRNFGTNATGKLRAVLFVTEDQWDDTLHRRVIGGYALARLKPGQFRSHLRKTVHLNRPPGGWYWLTVAVQERALDEDGKYRWFTRDHIEFDDRVYFAPRPRDIFWPF